MHDTIGIPPIVDTNVNERFDKEFEELYHMNKFKANKNIINESKIDWLWFEIPLCQAYAMMIGAFSIGLILGNILWDH